MGEASNSEPILTKLRWIAQMASEYPEFIFKTLAHLINVELLKIAYKQTNKDAAAGLDRVTAQDYAQELEENLRKLHERLKGGKYYAPPVKRVWLDKEDGSKRPIGIPEFEDKIVQRAVSIILNAVYEQDFYEFSYGFRENKSAHQALKELRENCIKLNIKWIIDADISGFFDNLNHAHLREIIKQRVNDGSILRLIGKWLNAGVMDGKELTFPEKGTPQGGVISPLLANIYLHHVLDDWFVKQVQPHLQGHSFIVRFADDFIIGCEREDDARWLMTELVKRFAQFGLTIHPEKSRLIYFGKPNKSAANNKHDNTFDFLGFTHYWAFGLCGYWVIKRKTARKRIRRTIKRIWLWCRNHRHDPITEQYKTIVQKLRGHYQYFAIRCNMRWLEKVRKIVIQSWRYWLNRRGGKFISWDKMQQILLSLPLPLPRIIHNI